MNPRSRRGELGHQLRCVRGSHEKLDYIEVLQGSERFGGQREDLETPPDRFVPEGCRMLVETAEEFCRVDDEAGRQDAEALASPTERLADLVVEMEGAVA